MTTISVCIATYRRVDRLAAVLDDLAAQTRLPDEVTVVDNDAAASARPAVESRSPHAPFPIRYDVQPQKNISLTRNRTVALAGGDWLAFIDDDERAPPEWLAQLLQAVTRHSADGVLGPVVPIVPASAPRWICRGRFYDFPRMPSGTVVPSNRLRFGNVMLRGAELRRAPPFDPAYGLTGGEDGDLLSRLTQSGSKLIWCDEAVVNEPVEASRLSLRWLKRRALSGGQDLSRHVLAGRYRHMKSFSPPVYFVGAAFKALIALLMIPVTLPFGRHRAAVWLLKWYANVGKLSVLWGSRAHEYA